MEEREFHNLDDLIADHERLRLEEGLKWDLSDRLETVTIRLAELRERKSGEESDRELLDLAVARSDQLYRRYLIGLVGGLVWAVFMTTVWVHGLDILWYLVPLVFLLLFIAEGERGKRLKDAAALFGDYPGLRQLAVREHAHGGTHRVDLAKVWVRPVELKQALRNLRIFDRFRWSGQPDAERARSGHRLLPTIVFTVIPMMLNWQRDGWLAFAVLLGGISLVLFSYVLIALGNTVRILLAQSGPRTASDLVRLEREFPGVPTETGKKKPGPQVESDEFPKHMQWLAKNVRRAGYQREPDYRMCVELEKPSLRWSALGALLVLFASYRVGAIENVTSFDVISIGTMICWTVYHASRVIQIDKVRAQFEKFARQDLHELELVDRTGSVISLGNTDEVSLRSAASEI